MLHTIPTDVISSVAERLPYQDAMVFASTCSAACEAARVAHPPLECGPEWERFWAFCETLLRVAKKKELDTRLQGLIGVENRLHCRVTEMYTSIEVCASRGLRAPFHTFDVEMIVAHAAPYNTASGTVTSVRITAGHIMLTRRYVAPQDNDATEWVVNLDIDPSCLFITMDDLTRQARALRRLAGKVFFTPDDTFCMDNDPYWDFLDLIETGEQGLKERIHEDPTVLDRMFVQPLMQSFQLQM